jgi:hypothetical protein
MHLVVCLDAVGSGWKGCSKEVGVGSGWLCREVGRLLRMEETRYIPEVLGSCLAGACDRPQSVKFSLQLVIDIRPHSGACGVAHVLSGCHMPNTAIQTPLERLRRRCDHNKLVHQSTSVCHEPTCNYILFANPTPLNIFLLHPKPSSSYLLCKPQSTVSPETPAHHHESSVLPGYHRHRHALRNVGASHS